MMAKAALSGLLAFCQSFVVPLPILRASACLDRSVGACPVLFAGLAVCHAFVAARTCHLSASRES
jgi:hypothetical protein